jgi:hypothetical protein
MMQPDSEAVGVCEAVGVASKDIETEGEELGETVGQFSVLRWSRMCEDVTVSNRFSVVES